MLFGFSWSAAVLFYVSLNNVVRFVFEDSQVKERGKERRQRMCEWLQSMASL